jgi:hypothetical protein
MIDNQRSFDNAMVRSSCQARTSGQKNTLTMTCINAFVPVWGFGSFSTITAPSFPNITYNSTWPLVYNKLVEAWTDSLGGSRTRTTEYSPYVDIYKTTVSTGSVQNLATITSSTITAALATITGLDITGLITINYTATLSVLFDPLSSWATLTAQTESLLALVNQSDAGNIYFLLGGHIAWGASAIIFPVSYGPGYVLDVLDIGMVCAAARGLGVYSTNPGYVGSLFGANPPFQNSIVDIYNITRAGLAPLLVQNAGGIMSAKSWWILRGAAPYPTWENPNAHTTIYMQSMTLDATTGAPTINAVSAASGYSNPVTAPSSMAFTPSDVTANTGTPYGVLGFRSVAI